MSFARKIVIRRTRNEEKKGKVQENEPEERLSDTEN
jgi:hypothetical protein